MGFGSGGLHIWISDSRRPHSAWLILTVYSVAFAVLAVVGDLWLRTAPVVHVSEKPDPTGWFGRLVSFGFGALFGLFMSVGILSEVMGWGDIAAIKLVFVICIIGCGVLSAKYGDDFWRGMLG